MNMNKIFYMVLLMSNFLYSKESSLLCPEDKNIVVPLIREELDYSYCLDHRMGRDLASIHSKRLKAKFYNSKVRLLRFFEKSTLFHSEVVTFDPDESNYETYCGE
jgi:hypothetical protein